MSRSVSAVLALLTAFPVTQTEAQQRGNRFVTNLLSANDKNKDGVITQDEATGRLKRDFDRVDSDGNGEITRKEILALGARLATRNPNANRSRPQVRVPDNVDFQTDIAYREGNPKWMLDLARPKAALDEPRPAIVFVHGGGWRSGDKGGGQWRSLPLEYASRGYVCITINYRLTDEGTVADCIADSKCAVRWLRAHAKKYNVDSKRIGAYGNSAGAHLVSVLGLTSADAGLEGDGPWQEFSSELQAVCCSAPPANLMDWGKKSRSGADALSRLFKGIDADEWRRKASPVTYASAKAPPFLIVHGTSDTTVPIKHGDELAKSLRDAGANDIAYLRFDGAGHGVFGEHADETGPAMQKFFDRVLGVTQ